MMVSGDYIRSKRMINIEVLVGIYTNAKLYNKGLLQLAYVDDQAQSLGSAFEGKSICLPFVHVCPMEEVAPASSDGGPFVNTFDKAGCDSSSSISNSDWQFTLITIHVWEKGTHRKGNRKVHSFDVCCKCFCHVAHIVAIRRGDVVDDLSQSKNIMIVELNCVAPHNVATKLI